MYTFQKVFGVVALLSLSHFTTANAVPPRPSPRPSPCYTFTETLPYTKTEGCPSLETCPPHILCIELKTATLTVPCPIDRCPATPTATVTAASSCKTCQTGCATQTDTVTVTSEGCKATTTSVSDIYSAL